MEMLQDKAKSKTTSQNLIKLVEILRKHKTTFCVWLVFFLVFMTDVIVFMGHPATLSIGGWFYVCRTAFAWSSLFIAPLLLFQNKSFLFYSVIFPVILLIEICEAFSLISFNQIITGNIVYILIVSSVDEIWRFLKLYTTIGSVALLTFYVLCCVAFLILLRKSHPPKGAWSFALGTVCMMLFFLNDIGLLSDKNIESVFSRTLTGFLPIDIVKNIRDYRSLLSAVSLPKLPEFTTPAHILHEKSENKSSSPPLLGIIVVGESATRNNWSLYGYSRDTTPEMQKVYDRGELVVWNDVVGAEPSTCLALQKLFSQMTVENPGDFRCTIFDVMNAAGINTILLSSQNQWGNENGQLIAVFANIKTKQYKKRQKKPMMIIWSRC